MLEQALCWHLAAFSYVGGREAGPQKAGPGSPPLPRILGFYRKVLRKVSRSEEPVEEQFCRTPRVLQNFKEPRPPFPVNGEIAL